MVLVEAEDAEELMGLVNKNEEAKVRIEILIEQSKWVSTEYTSVKYCKVLLLCCEFFVQGNNFL